MSQKVASQVIQDARSSELSQRNFKTQSTQQNVSSLSPNSEYYDDSKAKQSKKESIKSTKKRSIGGSQNPIKEEL